MTRMFCYGDQIFIPWSTEQTWLKRLVKFEGIEIRGFRVPYFLKQIWVLIKSQNEINRT